MFTSLLVFITLICLPIYDVVQCVVSFFGFSFALSFSFDNSPVQSLHFSLAEDGHLVPIFKLEKNKKIILI